MLFATLVLQVATIAVHGIITQQSNLSTPVKFEDGRSTLIKFEDEKTVPRHSRKINGMPPKIQNWKSVLKDATFQSLIKHTGFTPSLEEKMESDRLLWEKLQAAKFLRKSTGKGEDPNEKVKMGVLVDMTADGGSLEFRQSDKSVYTCPDRKCEQVLRRLLAIWKVQRFEPNDTWIRIKVPRHKQDEDVYEYTPKHGLQQMNTRFSKTPNSLTKNTTADVDNEPTASTNEQKNIEEKEPVLDERLSKIGRRMDLGKSTIYEVKHSRAREYLVNKGIIETSEKYDPYSIPQTLSQQIRFMGNSDKPRKNLFFQIQPVEPSVISIEPKVMKEFQTGKGFYDGFKPSLGPTGSPFTTIDYALQFAENFPKFTEYATEIHHNTGNRGKISFRPSPKFVQYSELDPIYHSDTTPTLLPQKNDHWPINFSKDVNSTLKSTILKTPPPALNSSMKAISKLTTELEHEEQTDSSINVSKYADTKGNDIHLVTKPPPKRGHAKLKNQLKSILRVNSGEVQDYAPLYAKWGEKIKTTPRPRTTTMQPVVSPTNTVENTTKITFALVMKGVDGEGNVQSSKLDQMQRISNRNTTQSNTNMILEDIEDKTPEEVVNALTNLGVRNTSRVEGYPPVSEKTLETSSKILEKMNRESKSPATDPISLIVNRISQSYSYRTSTGNVKNFRKMRRRLGHR